MSKMENTGNALAIIEDGNVSFQDDTDVPHANQEIVINYEHGTNNEAEKLVSANLINVLQARVFNDLAIVFNARLPEMFTELVAHKLESIVDDRLEALVEAKINEITTNTTQNASVLDATNSKIDQSMEDQILKIITPKLDKVNTEIQSLQNELKNINAETKLKKTANKKQQELSDKELATLIQKQEIDHPNDEVLQRRLDYLETQNDLLLTQLDSLEQYSRRETLEFHGIPNYQSSQKEENTTEVIIEFLNYYLGLCINKFDISVSHRMSLPEEKKKYGNDYIPPIYCKFVNRSLVYTILRRKHMLKHERNYFEKKFFIRENLTQYRRTIRDRAETELTSYRFKWVRNGNIFARKNNGSKITKISSEFILNRLINEQDKPDVKQINIKRFDAHSVPLRNEFQRDEASTTQSSPVVNYAQVTQFPPLQSQSTPNLSSYPNNMISYSLRDKHTPHHSTLITNYNLQNKTFCKEVTC